MPGKEIHEVAQVVQSLFQQLPFGQAKEEETDQEQGGGKQQGNIDNNLGAQADRPSHRQSSQAAGRERKQPGGRESERGKSASKLITLHAVVNSGS
jgi:hypothetical protein